jgi:hypothetical protein
MARARSQGAQIYDFAAYRVARQLLERHGSAAVGIVAGKVEATQVEGQAEDHKLWLHILDAVWTMSRRQPFSDAGRAA